MTVERGLCAVGASVGRIGLLECYKLLQLNQTPTPDVDRQRQLQLRQSNVCDRSDDILKALRTLRLSRSSLSARSLTKRLRPRAEAEPARAHQHTYITTGTHNENTKRLQCVFAAAGKRNKLAN